MTYIPGFEEFQRAVESSQATDIDFISAAYRGDLGATEVFVEAARGKLLYEKVTSCWYYYDGSSRLWKPDPAKSHVVEETGKLWDMCQMFIAEHPDISGTTLEVIENWRKKLQSNAGREGMLRMARGARSIWVTEDLWDRDPYQVHTPNTLFNVKERDVRDAEPSDYLTCQTKAKFDPLAECPLWEDTVKQVFSGDMELVDYFQRAMGYTILGLPNGSTEQKMFLCYGPRGSNGKNTLIDTIAEIIGDYAGTASGDSFNQTSKDIPEDIHSMRHKRMIVASEPDRKNTVNEEMIKALTGNREVRTRPLYENSTVWVPKFCIWMLANHYPRVANSPSLFRRIVVLPFNESFTGEKKKFGLGQQIVNNESSGVLNWLLIGAMNWLERGLEVDVPKAVTDAHKAFLDSTDVLGTFISEELEMLPETAGRTEEGAQVFQAYKIFCSENNYMPLGRNRFYAEMIARNCDMVKQGSGMRSFVNLRLKKGNLK